MTSEKLGWTADARGKPALVDGKNGPPKQAQPKGAQADSGAQETRLAQPDKPANAAKPCGWLKPGVKLPSWLADE